MYKWGEEGYAVVAIQSEIGEQDAEKALYLGLAALKAHKDVDQKEKFAVFGAFDLWQGSSV